jgi:hypothetical protein
MSVSAGIAAGAAAQSAAAAVAARAAKVTACTQFVQGYQHDRATVAEMREYAGCVEAPHPTPVSDSTALGIKAAIVIVLVCMVIGAIRGDTFDSGIGDRAFAAFFWAAGAAGTLLAGLLIFAGVAYVIR